MSWDAARNILAVRLDNGGDVVMLGPALRAVKARAPDARITLLATPAGEAAAVLLPWVDDVIVWEPVWQALTPPPLNPGREVELVQILAEISFDAALIFTSFSQTPHVPGYLCLLAGIPLRAGESKEFGGATLTTELRDAPDGLHQVERNLRLVEAVGFAATDRALAIHVPEHARDAVPALLSAAGLDPARPFVLLHPGASARARRYPADRYGAVAAGLAARGWPVIVTGTERERATVEAVVAAAHPTPLAHLIGGTTLPEYAALISTAVVVVCGNTLPMHLADATRTPAVVLYSGTDLESQWRPRATRAVLLRQPTPCHPCYRFDCPIGLPCLDIAPETVLAATEALTKPATDAASEVRAFAATSPVRREDGASFVSSRAGQPPLPPLPDPTSVRKIAVFRAIFLGDLLCATPALGALRSRFPDAEISLIGLPWAADLVRRLPSLDRLEAFPGYPGLPEVPYDAGRTEAFFARTRAYGYDLAIQLHGSGGIGNGFVRDLGAAATLGYRLDPNDDRVTLGLPWDPDEHEAARWLRLVGVVGATTDTVRYDFPIADDEIATATTLLAPMAGHGPLIGLHVGAKEEARRWPVASFATLADRLWREHGARIVLTGGDPERDLTAAVASASHGPSLDLAGKTDLGVFAAVIAGLDLLVTNDTGASHLAAASGIPSVVLFGPSRPYQWAPPDHDRHTVVDAVALATLAGTDITPAEALAALPVQRVFDACARKLQEAR